MSSSEWQELLKYPNKGDHIVQLYQDDIFLQQSLTEFISTGLTKNEGIITISTPAHIQKIRQQLESAGFNVNQAISRGQLTLLDAEQTLTLFMRDGLPHWQTFLETVGKVVEKACTQYSTVRAYGEMVDLLWQQSNTAAAILLEEYWNKLSKIYSFSLLCAYYIDHLHEDICSEPFKRICHEHSHVIPTHDYDQFEQAVTRAGEEVLSPLLCGMLQKLARNYSLSDRMPAAQATLMYMRETMPRSADKVISRIRENYSPEKN